MSKNIKEQWKMLFESSAPSKKICRELLLRVYPPFLMAWTDLQTIIETEEHARIRKLKSDLKRWQIRILGDTRDTLSFESYAPASPPVVIWYPSLLDGFSKWGLAHVQPSPSPDELGIQNGIHARFIGGKVRVEIDLTCTEDSIIKEVRAIIRQYDALIDKAIEFTRLFYSKDDSNEKRAVMDLFNQDKDYFYKTYILPGRNHYVFESDDVTIRKKKFRGSPGKSNSRVRPTSYTLPYVGPSFEPQHRDLELFESYCRGVSQDRLMKMFRGNDKSPIKRRLKAIYNFVDPKGLSENWWTERGRPGRRSDFNK